MKSFFEALRENKAAIIALFKGNGARLTALLMLQLPITALAVIGLNHIFKWF